MRVPTRAIAGETESPPGAPCPSSKFLLRKDEERRSEKASQGGSRTSCEIALERGETGSLTHVKGASSRARRGCRDIVSPVARVLYRGYTPARTRRRNATRSDASSRGQRGCD